MKRIADEPLLAFHFGLSGLQRVSEVPKLPREGIAPAIETQEILQLDALFGTAPLDERLQAMSVPTISDSRLLEPAAYDAALDAAGRLLLDKAKTSDPEDARLFFEAFSVLEEAQADRDLLRMAHTALMRA
jgi:hypothetical protein